jgi:alpha-beta hydrolase superfamily lysophospholipase
LFGFGRPRLETDAFTSFDGARLPTMVWRPTETRPAPEREVVIVALHGFDDYARAFEIAGPFWAARGATTYAYDQRGFGRAPERGLWPGQKALVEDLGVFCALVRQRHPGALIAVAGESMGGAVAIAAFASSSPPAADRLVLLSPAVWGWSEQPLTNEVGLWLLDHLDPGLSLTPPAFVASQHRCSDNERVLQEMDKDPLEINATRTDATCGLIDLMERASRDIAALRLPTLYLYGAKDTMIPKTAAFRAAARLGRRGRTAFYPEGWHLLDRDLQAGRVLADALGFIRDPLAPLPSRPGPIPAPETLTA